ncbi:hypothetical protein DVH05_010780 [Phytophthora capsici]|nr:hypothetical protein DVH05_010780 [Phytophthora capsici]
MLGLLWGEGWSVWRAAKKARLDKLEELLEVELQPNVVVNRKHPVRGLTPLMAASRAKNTTSVADCVRILISYGADVNIVANTKNKNTALHYAASNNKATAIEVLLDAGANIFARNADGLTALDIAWINSRREASRVLMKRVQLRSGWLDMSAKLSTPRRKRCWCVVLGDSDDSAQLCAFNHPDDVRPSKMLLFGSSSSIVIPSWSPFEFHVDGVQVQHLRLRNGTVAREETQICHEFFFATREPHSGRQSWVKALRANCAFTTGDRRVPRIQRQQLAQSSQRAVRKRLPSPSSSGRRSV